MAFSAQAEGKTARMAAVRRAKGDRESRMVADVPDGLLVENSSCREDAICARAKRVVNAEVGGSNDGKW